jgi:hypothetical protein
MYCKRALQNSLLRAKIRKGRCLQKSRGEFEKSREVQQTRPFQIHIIIVLFFL